MLLPRKFTAVLVFFTGSCAFGQSNQSFVTSFNSITTTSRNNYSGFVGMQFTVGATPITVTSLGRMNFSGFNGGVHTLKLVNAQTAVDVPGGSAQVTMIESTPGVNVFNYANLPAPIQLQANATYNLLSQETVNGDYWWDINPVTTTNVAVIKGGVYTDTTGAQILVAQSAGECYVPLTFLYGSSTPTYPPPTVSLVTPSGIQTPAQFAAQATAAVGAIASVQFQVDGQNYGAPATAITPDTNEYYTTSVVTNSLLNGTHSLTAIATDSFGDSATSSPITFTYTSTDVPLLTGQTLGALRNNYGDPYGHFVGLKFTVGSEHLYVYELGRYVAPGNSQTHLLKLVNAATGADVPNGSVTVSLAGAAAAQYAYGNLTTPVLLLANTSYYLVSQETIGGDQWHDYAPVTPSTLGSVNGSVYQADSGAFILLPNSTNSSYVPVNLGAAPVPGPYTIDVTISSITPGPTNSVYSGVLGVQIGVSPVSQLLPIVTVQLQVDGHAFGSPATAANSSVPTYGGIYQAFLDTTQLNNGTHTLTVVATDVAGDTGVSASQVLNVSNAISTSSNQAFVTSFKPTFLRNNFSGWVGMQFTVGSGPLQVPSLGRYCVAGNSGAHTVKLVQAPAGTDVAGGSVSISMSGCTAGQFVYAPLASPLALAAGSSYYLASQETSGGDQWYDYSQVSTGAGATVNGPVYFSGAQWVTVPSPSSSYVPVNFLITTGGSAVPLTVTTALLGSVVTAAPVGGGAILGVQFQIDGINIYSEVTTPPYTLTVPSLAYGTHKITAIAYDSLGNTATSSPIEDDSVCNCGPLVLEEVMTFAPTTLRNNYTGWVGFQFTTGVFGFDNNQPAVVELSCVAGNTQAHIAKLVYAATGLDVPGGAMWLNFPSSCGAAFSGQAVVPLPVLAPSTSYYLVIQETSGGDKWYDLSPAAAKPFNQFPTYTEIAAPFTIDGPVYFDGSKYVLVPLPNYSYVGLLFAGFASLV